MKTWNNYYIDVTSMQFLHSRWFLDPEMSSFVSSVSLLQGVNNRWNRWSENQSINRWQSMPINRLVSIIDEQLMLKFYVIIDFIDYEFLSIINTNRSVNLHWLSAIGCHFLSVLFSVKIFKTGSLYASKLKTAIKL